MHRSNRLHQLPSLGLGQGLGPPLLMVIKIRRKIKRERNEKGWT